MQRIVESSRPNKNSERRIFSSNGEHLIFCELDPVIPPIEIAFLTETPGILAYVNKEYINKLKL